MIHELFFQEFPQTTQAYWKKTACDHSLVEIKVRKGSKCSNIKFLLNNELKNQTLRAQEHNNQGLTRRELTKN